MQRQYNLHKDLQMVFDNLDYDFSNFTMNGFLKWLEDKTERQIQLIPWSVSPFMSGAWFSAGNRDYIFYDKAAPRMLQQHIQLNHLSRIILGHETLDIDPLKGLENESDIEQVAFRGELNEKSRQVLLDMIAYIIEVENDMD